MEIRTTIRLNQTLLEQAKARARRNEETLTSLIERGVRLALADRPATGKSAKVKIPVCRAGGGVLPGVDLDNTDALMDLL